MPANKNNVNDNTSGVSTVFSLMERIPAELRSRVAFVLFDNEEKGLVGSSAYAKAHPAQAENTLVLNMDCVGDGETIIMSVNKQARELPEVALLEKTMQATEGCKFLMHRKFSLLLSDHMNFKKGIAVGSFLYKKVIGYYEDKLHTPKDTVCDEKNIVDLTEGLTAFVAQLAKEA